MTMKQCGLPVLVLLHSCLGDGPVHLGHVCLQTPLMSVLGYPITDDI